MKGNFAAIALIAVGLALFLTPDDNGRKGSGS